MGQGEKSALRFSFLKLLFQESCPQKVDDANTYPRRNSEEIYCTFKW